MARYSASAEDFETVFCFLVFQETKDEPRKMQYPVRDLADNLQDPQSASQYVVSCMGLVEE